ncbi:NAD-dependent epimerase/dehydratase family protein [Actinocorallia longicatena]|uniref:NAD-dependent epimerase/dehydratase family protein n=1 Tax=Actinocorallia longicatena TaxID=111803 RepID=A0ABP6QU80_9ACTN
MGKHVIAGAGQVGTHLAELLRGQGHEVVVVTRSGSGPEGVTRIAADVGDQARLTEIARGADALYNAVNPPYDKWAAAWPPMASSFLGTAEATGAVLVTLSCLYGYGPVDGPMTEDLPMAARGTKGRVRARMWADALAAHRAGRIRMTELRGSDYYGPGAGDQAYLGDRFVPALLAGRRAFFLSDPGIPHSWTYLPDVARALALAGTDERAWGRAWHVPSVPPLSALEMGRRLTRLAGAPEPRISELPRPLMNAAGLFSPLLREMRETRYQFDRPYVLDSSAFETAFGMAPTPVGEGLKAVIAAEGREVSAVPAGK